MTSGRILSFGTVSVIWDMKWHYQGKKVYYMWERYRHLTSFHQPGHSGISANTMEIAVCMKTMEGHHSITIDPWSLHPQLKRLGPCFRPSPELRYKMDRPLEEMK